jgi:hypothetical protein
VVVPDPVVPVVLVPVVPEVDPGVPVLPVVPVLVEVVPLVLEVVVVLVLVEVLAGPEVELAVVPAAVVVPLVEVAEVLVLPLPPLPQPLAATASIKDNKVRRRDIVMCVYSPRNFRPYNQEWRPSVGRHSLRHYPLSLPRPTSLY